MTHAVYRYSTFTRLSGHPAIDNLRFEFMRHFKSKPSANIVKAIDLAKARSAKVLGIVGRDSGYTAKHGDVLVLIPTDNPSWAIPLSEAFQAVVRALSRQSSGVAAK
jgi:hypothetical protein